MEHFVDSTEGNKAADIILVVGTSHLTGMPALTQARQAAAES